MHPVRIERTSQALQASANPSQLKVQILANLLGLEPRPYGFGDRHAVQ
ncbi:hypothetical protein [Escherichia phage PNJ1902]|nr:hypothetical protein [Escherichia phage PNJ1902]